MTSWGLPRRDGSYAAQGLPYPGRAGTAENTTDPFDSMLGDVSDTDDWPAVDYRGCPCGPMPQADGFVYGCPVHDPNPPTRKEN